MPLCPSCGEDNPERFRLCGFCGTQLAVALPAQEVRKTVTIVFSDLQGSTALGEALDSESLREVLNRYFGRMQAILERHGGTVEKFIGDAIMAVFGLPRLHEDDALRAVRAAYEMTVALAELNVELQRHYGISLTHRTGVNTGEVVAGDVATGQRLVTGDAVNTAARLEQAADPNGVFIGEPTYRLVREAVEVAPVEPLALKGKAEPVPAYRLLGVTEGEAIVRRLDAPMVGRAGEMRLLTGAFERAVADRACHLVTVVGPAGLGKSRLKKEFVDAVAGEADALRGRCLSYGEGITFWPLAEAVRSAAGVTEEDTVEETLTKLAALLPADATDVAERVAAAIGVSPACFPVEETFWATRKLFENLARRRPLVVVFEDIHWAEQSFLDLIEHLTDHTDDAPIVIVCSARPELFEGRPDWGRTARNVQRIVLDSLSEGESALIVDNMLGQAGLDAAVRSRITAAAEGNPLFVEQLCSMLIEDGRLVPEEGHLVLAGSAEELAIPPTISALLSARLDRLASEERVVIERASVIGVAFHQRAVEHLAPEPLQPRVGTSLLTLTHKELIRPDESTFAGEAHRFHHVLIRDTAYGAMLKRTRAELHELFVEWLERTAGPRVTEYEEILGYHLEQAYRYRSRLGPLDEAGRLLGARAAERLRAAGRRAFDRGDMPAAVNLLDRAAALLPTEAPDRLELLPALAEALMDIGELRRAEDVLEDAIRGAETLGDERLRAEAHVVRLLVRFSTDPDGWGEQALEDAEKVVPIFEAVGDQASLAKTWRVVAYVHGAACRYTAVEESTQRAIDCARLAGDRRQETRNYATYALSALYGRTPVAEAVERCQRLLEHAKGDRRAESVVLCGLAHLKGMQGAFDEARSLYTRSRAMSEDLGGKVLSALTSLDSSAVEMLAGDPAAAERELRQDLETLRRMGERNFISTTAALLAQAIYAQGRYQEAVEFSRISEESAVPDDADAQVPWRGARGKALAQMGDLREARVLLTVAVAIARDTEETELLADALMDLAEGRRLAGDDAAAASAAEEALELHVRKGNLVSAERARSLLAALTAPRPG